MPEALSTLASLATALHVTMAELLAPVQPHKNTKSVLEDYEAGIWANNDELRRRGRRGFSTLPSWRQTGTGGKECLPSTRNYFLSST